MNKYKNYCTEWLISSKTYGEHVSAMTKEELHNKSDIAAELAWRDEQLAKANERVVKLGRMVSDLELVCAIGGDKEWQIKLNKFALEQKIEVLESFVSISGAMANHWCDKEHAGYMMFHTKVVTELWRLRKELEK